MYTAEGRVAPTCCFATFQRLRSKCLDTRCDKHGKRANTSTEPRHVGASAAALVGCCLEADSVGVPRGLPRRSTTAHVPNLKLQMAQDYDQLLLEYMQVLNEVLQTTIMKSNPQDEHAQSNPHHGTPTAVQVQPPSSSRVSEYLMTHRVPY